MFFAPAFALMNDVIATNQIIYDLKSGVRVFVTPLTLFGRAHFLKQTAAAYPDPDPKPFEKPLENAFIEGDVIPAIDNPDYQKLLAEAQIKREFHFMCLIIEAQTDMPEREKLLKQYRQVIKSTAGMVAVNRGIEVEIVGDFTRLLYASLATPAEVREIFDLATQQLPLEQGEIIGGLSFFAEWQYGGMSLLQMLTRRAHPVLIGDGLLTTDRFETELAAAAHFGVLVESSGSIRGSWFSLAREERALMVAAYRVDQINRAITEYDAIKRAQVKRGSKHG